MLPFARFNPDGKVGEGELPPQTLWLPPKKCLTLLQNEIHFTSQTTSETISEDLISKCGSPRYVEIKHYSVAYFDCVTAFEAL